MVLNMLAKETTGVAVGGGHDLFGGAGGDDFAAPVATFGAEVYDMVGTVDDVQMVFYDHDRVTGVGQTVYADQ